MEWSRISSLFFSPNIFATKSSPIRSATSSRDIFVSSSRIRAATPLIPTRTSTRSARSLAIGISTSVLGSRPSRRASAAIEIARESSSMRDFP